MLQRIQSLYLLLTTILSLLFLKGNFLRIINKAGNQLAMNFSGIYQADGADGFFLVTRIFPVSVLIIIIPVISLLSIFFYKNRKLQMKVVAALIVLTVVWIGLIVYYMLASAEGSGASFIPGVKVFLAPVIFIFAVLAYRAIRRDENLVRSYDRLR